MVTAIDGMGKKLVTQMDELAHQMVEEAPLVLLLHLTYLLLQAQILVQDEVLAQIVVDEIMECIDHEILSLFNTIMHLTKMTDMQQQHDIQ
jgi:hypothetical protein